MKIVLNPPPAVLPNKVLKPAQRLLQRMNQTTTRVDTNSGMNFISRITAGIIVNGELALRDPSYFTVPVKKNTLMRGKAILQLREPDVSIAFDKGSGAILAVEPPYMGTPTEIENVFKIMQKHLNQAEHDFEKKSVVKKKVLNVEGVSYKAAHRIREVIIKPDYSLLEKTQHRPLLQRVYKILNKFLMS